MRRLGEPYGRVAQRHGGLDYLQRYDPSQYGPDSGPAKRRSYQFLLHARPRQLDLTLEHLRLMPTLSVPVPTLSISNSVATLEKPVEFSSVGPTLPDGFAFTRTHLGKAGFFILRRTGGSASDEIWDGKAKTWRPAVDPVNSDLEPAPLLYKENVARWQGLFVAAGQKDKNDHDQFQKAVPDYPQYAVQTFFEARNGAETLAGVSPASARFRFVSLADTIKAGLALGPNQTTENATELTIFLRSGGHVKLLPTGDVEIAPGPGRRIFLRGQVETQEILYQPGPPGSLGAKRWLT